MPKKERISMEVTADIKKQAKRLAVSRGFVHRFTNKANLTALFVDLIENAETEGE